MTHTVVLGPSNPASLARHLHPSDAVKALSTRGLGGTPVTMLVDAMVSCGQKVDLITLSFGETEDIILEGDLLRILIGPYRSQARNRAIDLFAAERQALSRLLNQSAGDLLHAHWTYEFAWPAMSDGRAVLVTAHDSPFTVLRHHRDAYRAARLLMAARVGVGARAMTAVSPYLSARWTRGTLGLQHPVVVPNLVAPKALEYFSRRQGRLRGEVVVSVTNASPLKNVGVLLQAFASFKALRGSPILRLIGPGLAGNSPLAQKAREARQDVGVEFLGERSHDEALALVAEADLMVHTSLEESHPLAVAEAMAMGVVVVGGARAGGVPWTLGNGAAGRIVDVTSPAQVAAAMNELFEDDAEMDGLSLSGHAQATERFSGPNVLRAYDGVYSQLRDSGIVRKQKRVN